LTPDNLLVWTLSLVCSGLLICLLALGIRGTVRIFMSKDEAKEEEEYELGHPKRPPIPPPKQTT
jgi:hypothetical protein